MIYRTLLLFVGYLCYPDIYTIRYWANANSSDCTADICSLFVIAPLFCLIQVIDYRCVVVVDYERFWVLPTL